MSADAAAVFGSWFWAGAGLLVGLAAGLGIVALLLLGASALWALLAALARRMG